jgi:hypothetical protein
MFERQHKRKPSKVDIKNAPPEIQKCYKDYIILKKEKSQVSAGHDVFGSHLNKSKEIIEKTEERENLVAIKPNLRKKFDIKKSKAKQATESIAETSIIDCLGLDSFIAGSENTTDTTDILPVKSNSFFKEKSADILKKLEKQDSGLSFHEIRSRKSHLSSNKENINCLIQNVTEPQDSSARAETKAGNMLDENNPLNVFEMPEDNANYTPKKCVTPLSSENNKRDDSPLNVTLKSNLTINEDLLNQEQVINL